MLFALDGETGHDFKAAQPGLIERNTELFPPVIRQAGCERQIFRHNDVQHLESLLVDTDPARPKIIAFESVCSMDGDIAPIEQIT